MGFFYILLHCTDYLCCFYVVFYFTFAPLLFVFVLIPLATV